MTTLETIKIEGKAVHQTRKAILIQRPSDQKVTWIPRFACEDLGDDKWEVGEKFVSWVEDTRRNRSQRQASATVPRKRRTTRRRGSLQPVRVKTYKLDDGKLEGSQAGVINLALSTNEAKTPLELARETDLPLSRVKHHLKVMERRGYVETVSWDWNDEHGSSSTGTGSSGDNGSATSSRGDHSTGELVKLQDENAKLSDKLKNAQEQLSKAKEEATSTVKEIVIKTDKGEERKFDGLVHEQFERVVQLASARMNIFLFGPTGCGKSHLCKQVAEALGLNFAFVSCTAGMAEGVLGGRLLPVGESGKFEYVISEFIKAYEEGGVFLLDEIDAADANVLLLVNAALANGRVAVPNRPEKPYAHKHEDFVCIAAANTAGTGADRMYSGRNQLDAATLDRFQIGKVACKYDERVEEQLCPDDDLRGRLLKIRKAIDEHRLERAMSTRFMKDAYAMKQVGWTDEQIDEAFFTGWRDDEVAKVKNYIG